LDHVTIKGLYNSCKKYDSKRVTNTPDYGYGFYRDSPALCLCDTAFSDGVSRTMIAAAYDMLEYSKLTPQLWWLVAGFLDQILCKINLQNDIEAGEFTAAPCNL
jgi:hypothetical protein